MKFNRAWTHTKCSSAIVRRPFGCFTCGLFGGFQHQVQVVSRFSSVSIAVHELVSVQYGYDTIWVRTNYGSSCVSGTRARLHCQVHTIFTIVKMRSLLTRHTRSLNTCSSCGMASRMFCWKPNENLLTADEISPKTCVCFSFDGLTELEHPNKQTERENPIAQEQEKTSKQTQIARGMFCFHENRSKVFQRNGDDDGVPIRNEILIDTNVGPCVSHFGFDK